MDVVLLLLVAASGALALPIQVVLLAGGALTLISSRRKFEIARTYPDVGTSRILVGTLFLSLANNTVFSLLAFAVGRAAALLF